MTRRLTAEDERLWRAMTGQAAGVDHGRVRRLSAEEQKLWLSATGHAPTVKPAPSLPAKSVPPPIVPEPVVRTRPREPGPPGGIEPNRHRRIVRERDPIEARIDLHGLDQDRARAALERFLTWAQGSGHRAVLVITGKGLRSDGVLRRMTPEWLAQPPLRGLVAGIARADRRHGGEGAFYVALKRG
jgi:DNA-nicking Smr family endonuclease